jgi:hypothetical protein
MRLRTGTAFGVMVLGLGAWCALPAGCSSADTGGGNQGSPDAGTDADGGPDGAGDATDGGQTGAPPGSACWVDEDCQGGICWTPKKDGFPGGYCVIEGCTESSCPAGSVCVSFTDGVDRCVASCQSDSDCRQSEGYVCDGKHVCWYGVGTIPPGGSCGTDEQCMGQGAICIQQAGFVGGYCVIPDCTATSCPDGSECRQVFTSGASGCIPVYGADGSCRPGYEWVEDSSSKWFQSCYPGCADDADCPGDFGCREGTKGLICVDVSNECSAKNHQGDCPSGEVCKAGTCAPFVCNDTVLEPNQSQSAALPLPAADTQGLQICKGDDDWFSFTPSEAKKLYMVGIDSNHASGDLQVDLTDAAGVISNDATMDPAFYHSEGSVGPTNLELHALLGVPGSPKSFLHVHGVNGSQNNYALISRAVAYQDGPDCTAVFSTGECVAVNDAGAHDPSKLIVFPMPNALDTYVGNGVFFKNGLSAFGNPPYTSSARQWARREVVMAIRYAIHSVQQAFPGTAPLGIGDIGMPDGTTPEGHPNGTHYQGANADIAYYIRPDVLGQEGNLVYRQICCDAPLSDWSCVDTNPSSPSYGVCVAGSESTHIVDLSRTAMFIAKLAGTHRIRVIGVEAKIEAALEAAMDELLGKGQISADEASTGKSKMVTANDDPSWIWHFNHMHVSFQTKPSPLQDQARGLWLDLPPAEQAARARAFPRKLPR